MVLFQPDHPHIQMEVVEKKVRKGGASARQKGEAAQMRTYINENIKGKMNECLFKDLSYIVHSGDRNPQAAGANRFADPTNKEDPSANPILSAAFQNIKQVVALTNKGVHLPKTINCPRSLLEGRGCYMEQLSGGKMNTKVMKRFLDASYDGKKAAQNIDGYIRDTSLSGDRVSVYHNPATGKAIVVHRGSQGIHDWGNNLRMAFGWNMSSTKRFKHAKDIQQQAENKYGKQNITTLGHSLGGKIASDVGQDSDEIITLNKATGIGQDAYKKDMGSKSNETNVRTTLDPVSIKGALSSDFTIPSKSLNPITEHGVATLDRVDRDVGKGAGRRVVGGTEPYKGSWEEKRGEEEEEEMEEDEDDDDFGMGWSDLEEEMEEEAERTRLAAEGEQGSNEEKQGGKRPTFVRKEYMRLTKKQLKQIIKSLPKKRDEFKLTGAGKPSLVDYLESRCIKS